MQKILSFKTNGSLGYRIRSYITVLDIGGGNSQALTAVDPIIDGTGLLFFGPLLVGHRSNRMEQPSLIKGKKKKKNSHCSI